MTNEQTLEDIVLKGITDKANLMYPVNKVKDIDGDYIDINESKRNSFIEGSLYGMKLMKLLIASKK